MKTLSTLNCAYHALVLKILTSWPTVRLFQLMILTDQCDRPLVPIYHQPQELTRRHKARPEQGKAFFNEIIRLGASLICTLVGHT